MRDYKKEIDELMKENERLQILLKKSENDNIELLRAKAKLENELYENKKWTATVYEPHKCTYQQLELKLKKFESDKQKDIDELWETRIAPLQNEVKDKKIQLESAYKVNERQKEQIKYLEIAAEKLGMLINYAVGYISSCEQFRDKNPDYVKNWLFEGLNENINKPI